MHRCLQITEILFIIVQEADQIFKDNRRFGRTLDVPVAVGGGSNTYEDLRLRYDPALSLALCCKSFYEQATCVLWKELKSLLPLLNCFPHRVWTSYPGENPHVSHFHSVLRRCLILH